MGLVLMRHAHTDWNGPPARVQGQRDPGLSMVAGRTAAEALGATYASARSHHQKSRPPLS